MTKAVLRISVGQNCFDRKPQIHGLFVPFNWLELAAALKTELEKSGKAGLSHLAYAEKDSQHLLPSVIVYGHGKLWTRVRSTHLTLFSYTQKFLRENAGNDSFKPFDKMAEEVIADLSTGFLDFEIVPEFRVVEAPSNVFVESILLVVKPTEETALRLGEAWGKFATLSGKVAHAFGKKLFHVTLYTHAKNGIGVPTARDLKGMTRSIIELPGL